MVHWLKVGVELIGGNLQGGLAEGMRRDERGPAGLVNW